MIKVLRIIKNIKCLPLLNRRLDDDYKKYHEVCVPLSDPALPCILSPSSELRGVNIGVKISHFYSKIKIKINIMEWMKPCSFRCCCVVLKYFVRQGGSSTVDNGQFT